MLKSLYNHGKKLIPLGGGTNTSIETTDCFREGLEVTYPSPTLRILTKKLELLPDCSADHAAFLDLPSNCSDIPFAVVEHRLDIHVPKVHGPYVNGPAGDVVLLWGCARVSDFQFLHMQPRDC